MPSRRQQRSLKEARKMKMIVIEVILAALAVGFGASGLVITELEASKRSYKIVKTVYLIMTVALNMLAITMIVASLGAWRGI
jgi:uncharacterized membrane protein YgdD (TMEM256/DUF423 family)